MAQFAAAVSNREKPPAVCQHPGELCAPCVDFDELVFERPDRLVERCEVRGQAVDGSHVRIPSRATIVSASWSL